MRLESGEGVKLLGSDRGGRGGLGFGAGGEIVQLVRLENRHGGGDDDSLGFYVSITIPQIPLFEINVMVNKFSTRRAKERDLIFVSPEIKFSRGQITVLSSVW